MNELISEVVNELVKVMKAEKEKLQKGADSGNGFSGLATAFVTGAAAGLAVGVLISSDKGDNLKSKIKNLISDFTANDEDEEEEEDETSNGNRGSSSRSKSIGDSNSGSKTTNSNSGSKSSRSNSGSASGSGKSSSRPGSGGSSSRMKNTGDSTTGKKDDSTKKDS